MRFSSFYYINECAAVIYINIYIYLTYAFGEKKTFSFTAYASCISAAKKFTFKLFMSRSLFMKS